MLQDVLRQNNRLPFFILVLGLTLGCIGPGSAQLAVQTVTDVVVGHNNKGPYTLSWTEIDLKSVVAVINGRTLKSGEYTVDNTKGMLSFGAVLKQDAIVRITYSTTTKSKRTGGVTSVPVTLNVLNDPRANLQVTGLHVQTDANNPDAGKTIVGVSGGRMWGASKLNSQFLVSQQNDAGSGEQGSALDRSVIKFGGESKVGNVTFSGSMSSVGSKFGGEKEYNVAAGKQQSAFAVRFTPGKRVEASASISTARDTAGANDGAGSVVQEQNVTVRPTETTKVSLLHSTTASQTAAQGSERVVETSGVKLNQQIGGTTSASVSLQNTTVDSGGQTDGTTTQQLYVTSKPNDKIGVTAAVEQSNSDSQGETVKTNTSVQVSPVKQVSVAASHSTVENTKTGVATDTAVSFKANAASNTEIKGSLIEKNTSSQAQYQRDVSVSSSPIRYAKVTAVFSQKGVNDQDDVTKAATLELTPLTHTRLMAGYKHTQNASRVMTITDYAASSRPLSYLELSGSYRDRELRQDFAPDTTAVNVAISPFRFVSLRGAYQENPENDQGQIQNYQETKAGVKVRVGSVGVFADLAQKNEYKLMQQTEEHIFGVEMPVFGHGRLTTGYKNARLFGPAGTGSDTYTMGYCHNLGSAFNVSLTGNYTQYRSNTADPGKDRYEAQASVGIKF
jgi:hypothetical protein